MKREDLTELHYITPIANLASILAHGILSHNRVKRLRHRSVAMMDVQERRERKRVPGGRDLHDYANLYICGRNPMLSKRRSDNKSLAVLRISTDVLDLPGVVITDQNAACGLVRFRPSPDGLDIVDRELTFAQYWTHENPIEYKDRKARKCAEVLVPDCVAPSYIFGAYVSCPEARLVVETMGLEAVIDPHLFF